MILGYHVIIGMYGFWLPNDPRGSWSDFVGSWELYRYGPATKTNETRSVAKREHDAEQRRAAKNSLKYPAIKLTGIQARAVGQGFAHYVQRSGLQVWACAILPDHVHLVTAPFRLSIEKVVVQLKGDATQQLLEEAIHPLAPLCEAGERPPKCFARGEWSVFLETIEDIKRCIRYVEDNPLKEGLPKQKWRCVIPYGDLTSA